jgi:hypothetical protein
VTSAPAPRTFRAIAKVETKNGRITRRSNRRPRTGTVSQMCHAFGNHGGTQEDTSGHHVARNHVQEDPGGHGGTWEDIGRVRDRGAPGSNPGPPTKNRIQNRRFAGSAYPAVSQGRSQIFREVGGGSLRLSGLRPSIELAHGYRTADISERARPRDRATRGFENPTSRGSGKPASPEPPGLVTANRRWCWRTMVTRSARGLISSALDGLEAEVLPRPRLRGRTR